MSRRSTALKQKRSFWPQYGPQSSFEVSALLDVRNCPKLQSCPISKKTNNTTLRKCQISYFPTQFEALKFFFMIMFQAIILCNFPESKWANLEKNDKKPNFGPDFGPIDLNLGLQLFFWALNLY